MEKEKAKAYDQYGKALELAETYYKSTHFRNTLDVLETIFPELKKDEDEKVRKALIEYFTTSDNNSYYAVCGVAIKKVLAWLEKQGEQTINNIRCEGQKEINLVEILKHYPKETELYSPLYGRLWLAEVDEKNETITCYKRHLEEGCTRAVLEQEDTVSFYSNGTIGLPNFNISKDCMLFLYDVKKQGEKKSADKVEPKFKVGDWITDGQLICKVLSVTSKSYELHLYNDDYCHFETDVQSVDKYYHLWTIQDAKDGDVLCYEIENELSIFIYKNGHIHYHCCYCNGHLTTVNSFFVVDKYLLCYIHPATKEQRDFLFKKMKESGYMWDSESKQLLSLKVEPCDKQNSADLEEFINELSKQFPDVSFAKLSRIAVRVAKWAKPTDEEMKELLRTEYEKGRADVIAERQKPAWSEEDECYMAECINAIATKNGWSFEEKRKIKHWLESLKQKIADAIAEMKKPAWNGEDDYNVQCLVAKVNSDIQKGYIGRNQELIDWLESLKERIGG